MRPGPARPAVLCLAGAALVLLAAGRTWATGRLVPPPPLPPAVHAVHGADYLPALRGLGLLALAGVGGLLAARGRVRSAVGAVLAVAGGSIAVRCLLLLGAGSTGRPSPGAAWPIVAAAGGAAVLAAGGWVAVRGRTWSGLPARYERAAPADEAAAGGAPATWDALDRGEDPTAAAPAATTTLDP